jgi:hypothetical protein
VEVRRTGVFVTDANRAYFEAKIRHRHMLDPLAPIAAAAAPQSTGNGADAGAKLCEG